MNLTNIWQIDQDISPEIVRSVLAERSNWPGLATKSAHKVSAAFILFVCSLSTIICDFLPYHSAKALSMVFSFCIFV